MVGDRVGAVGGASDSRDGDGHQGCYLVGWCSHGEVGDEVDVEAGKRPQSEVGDDGHPQRLSVLGDALGGIECEAEGVTCIDCGCGTQRILGSGQILVWRVAGR